MKKKDFCNNIKDIDKLKLFLDSKYHDKKESSITDFCDAEIVFKWTNEDMKLYPKEILEGKKVLTITSSADHALDAILKGAKEIDSIDINIFCKYYSALKIAMIKKYDYDEFFDKIDFFVENISINKTPKFKVLDDISINLTKEELEFWNVYLNEKDSIFFPFFNRINEKGNLYSDKNEYNKLKDKILDVKITYYDGDIISIDEILPDKIYDCMYLSNVLERVNCCYSDDKINANNRNLLIKKLVSHLSDGGIIYNYFLGLTNTKMVDVFKKDLSPIEELFDIDYYCHTKEIKSYNHGVMVLKKN